MTEPDVAILAGRPVEPTEDEARIAARAGIDLSQHYSGSIEETCLGCNRGVWVGPMQQAMIATGKKCVIFCMMCAAKMAHMAGLDPNNDIHSLGNPENVN